MLRLTPPFPGASARLRREFFERVTWVGVVIALTCAVLAGVLIGFHYGYRVGWSDGCEATQGLDYLPAGPARPGLLPMCRIAEESHSACLW